jgi:hypothetical protein
MPTDLDAVSKRKRQAQDDDPQTTITIMSVCLIIYLGMLVLLLKVFGA